jgi:hypothetical protein
MADGDLENVPQAEPSAVHRQFDVSLHLTVLLDTGRNIQDPCLLQMEDLSVAGFRAVLVPKNPPNPRGRDVEVPRRVMEAYCQPPKVDRASEHLRPR